MEFEKTPSATVPDAHQSSATQMPDAPSVPTTADASIPPTGGAGMAEPPTVEPPKKGIANIWHMLVFIAVLLVFSYSGSNGQHAGVAKHGRWKFYSLTIAWEWVMVLYIWLGTRKRGIGLTNLIGGNEKLDRLLSRGVPEWSTMRDRTRRIFTLLIDTALGFFFWLVAIGVLAAFAKMLGLMRAGANSDFQQKIGFMAPQTGWELFLFLLLSATAGICEEIIFRGYLQRQFAAFTGSAVVGIVAQAVIFGAGHGYEGARRMMLIAVLGILLGILTYVRGSLKPAMVTHFCQDGIAGTVLYLISKKIIPMPQ